MCFCNFCVFQGISDPVCVRILSQVAPNHKIQYQTALINFGKHYTVSSPLGLFSSFTRHSGLCHCLFEANQSNLSKKFRKTYFWVDQHRNILLAFMSKICTLGMRLWLQMVEYQCYHKYACWTNCESVSEQNLPFCVKMVIKLCFDTKRIHFGPTYYDHYVCDTFNFTNIKHNMCQIK